jgi:hypothetical protein
MDSNVKVTIEDKNGDSKLVTMSRPKYDKRFQLQSRDEAFALWTAIQEEYGF